MLGSRALCELTQLGQHHGQVVVDGAPHDVLVHTEVLVDDEIAHVAHHAPRHVWPLPNDLVGDVRSGLAKHAQILDGRVDERAIGQELSLLEPVRQAYRRLRRVDMSATRRRQSLRGTDGLAQHLVADLGAQPAGRDHVDLRAEEVFDLVPQLADAKEAEWRARLLVDENIDVARLSGVTARKRSEDGEFAHTHFLKLRSMRSEYAEHVFAIDHLGHLPFTGIVAHCAAVVSRR